MAPESQDFTDGVWTHHDPNTRVSVSASQLLWNNLVRTDDAWHVRDKNFVENFTIAGQVNIGALTDGVVGYSGISNLEGTVVDHNDASEDLLYFYQAQSGGNVFLVLAEWDGASFYFDLSVVLAANTDYWYDFYRVEEDGAFGTIYLDFYTNAAKTVVKDNLVVALHTAKKDFTKINAILNEGAAAGAGFANGYHRDMTIDVPLVGAPSMLGLLRVGHA